MIDSWRFPISNLLVLVSNFFYFSAILGQFCSNNQKYVLILNNFEKFSTVNFFLSWVKKEDYIDVFIVLKQWFSTSVPRHIRVLWHTYCQGCQQLSLLLFCKKSALQLLIFAGKIANLYITTRISGKRPQLKRKKWAIFWPSPKTSVFQPILPSRCHQILITPTKGAARHAKKGWEPLSENICFVFSAIFRQTRSNRRMFRMFCDFSVKSIKTPDLSSIVSARLPSHDTWAERAT